LPRLSSEKLEVFNGATWNELTYRRIDVAAADIDIVVLALKDRLSQQLPVQLGAQGSYMSQEVFFLGFPLGLSVGAKGFNTPIVKHRILATPADRRDGKPFLIDGIGNPGFSGGPVVCGDPQKPLIIGVISAYRAVQEPVYKGQTATNDLTINTNTGLIVAYPLEYVLDAIKADGKSK
jgi:hypothetical protein